MGSFRESEWILTLFAMILGCYVWFCWMTAQNRRCQRGGLPKWAEEAKALDSGKDVLDDLGYNYNGSDDEFLSVWVPWQHHFYPIFLIFDSVFGLLMNSYVTALASAFTSGPGVRGDAKNQAAGHGNQTGTGTVQVFQRFFNYEAKMILIGCVLAILIFVFQFMMKAKFLSVLACVFCVAMYVTYALRRVPMMMLYCQYPPFVKKFGMSLDGANSAQVVPASKGIAP